MLFFSFIHIATLLQLEVQAVCDSESYGHVDGGYVTRNVWFYCWAGWHIALEGKGKENFHPWNTPYSLYIPSLFPIHCFNMTP